MFKSKRKGFNIYIDPTVRVGHEKGSILMINIKLSKEQLEVIIDLVQYQILTCYSNVKYQENLKKLLEKLDKEKKIDSHNK